MLPLIDRKHRREPIELQLTPMIDVFSMLVIFLIKGTVFGVSDISTPPTMKLPESVSKEAAESAPQVAIDGDKVRVSLVKDEIPLAAFRQPGSPQIEELKKQLKAYIGLLPPQARGSGVLLNVVADKAAPYQDVFDTVKVFRSAGFETLLFVATAPPQPEPTPGAR